MIASSENMEKGFTLIEMVVAILISAIVIGGSYAGYAFMSRQYEQMRSQTSIDSLTLRTIDLIQSDIRMAGYKDYQSLYAMIPSQAATISASVITTSPASHDISVVLDDYDIGSSTANRVLIRYYLQSYTPSGGQVRNRLIRDFRQCTNPALGCTLATSTSKYLSSTGGEPILDWVTNFSVTANNKTIGTFVGVPQLITINLGVTAPRKIEGTTTKVTKNFTFMTRLKNVSLVQ